MSHQDIANLITLSNITPSIHPDLTSYVTQQLNTLWPPDNSSGYISADRAGDPPVLTHCPTCTCQPTTHNPSYSVSFGMQLTPFGGSGPTTYGIRGLST